ncbi:efflux transporter outer membrane subunit [Comamonas suwonensis]|uniref:Efflux transporter outer membrane subunit n=1 Tax=Comamonas suwonensis TaxID=2606214 RepID=A0A843BF40_9BURK|nr:efflux transporter outer membrane subunit [Comamonas suwonensis]MBI1626507.1 efflux transporter outer membrane subunit [Comamonas suwonensis]
MRRLSMNISAIAAACAAALLAGCNLAPVYKTPDLPVPETVSANAAPVLASEVALQQAQALQWLQSPQLRDVVALALSNNRDLRVAVENIEKARAQYGITRADLLPGITAQAQGNRTRSAADLTTTGRSTINEQYTAQLGFASYELDLWGRIRNLSEASLQQFLLSQENQRNVQISLVADVSNAWLTLAADQARLQLAKDTLDSRIKAFELTRKMYELGSTSGLVLAQNQTTVDTARGDVASYTSQVDRDRNALQLLVGGPVPAPLLPTAQTLMNGAGDGIESGSDVAALKAVPVPLPSTVLLKRPDVQAAERNLQAMNASIGAARAAMFPSITLTGSIGTGSSDLDRLFGNGNSTWSFIPLVRLPIFDAGRNRANVQVAESNQRIALNQYEKFVQTAFREVADVLADRAQWGERLSAQTSMVANTQKAFDLSNARFKAGVDNYLSVLDAQRSLYTAQQTLIGLRLSEQLNRVTLWKALGGEEAAQQS